MTRQSMCAVRWHLQVCAVLAVAWGTNGLPAVAQDSTDQAAVRDFNKAAALQNNGLYARAADRWTEFVGKYPNDKRLDRAHYYLGVCQLHEKKPAEAVKAFETMLQRWPNFEQADGARYNLGMAYYQIAATSNKPEDFRKTADALAKVPAQSPNASRALYFQGESYYSAGDVEKAVDAYKKLTTDHGNSPLLGDALYALGTAQQELMRVDEAAATYTRFLAEQSLQNHELSSEIRLRLGMTLYDQKKYDEAEKLFEAVANKQGFPHADFALLRRAQCLQERDKTPEAAALFVELAKKFPNSTYLKSAQLAAGKCLYLTEKYDDARKQLEPIAGAAAEEAGEAAYWLGRTLLKMDRGADAFTVLDKAVAQIKEGEFVPHLILARIDAMYGMPDKRSQTSAECQAFLQKYADHTLAARATYLAALAALSDEDFETSRKFADQFLGNANNAAHELHPAVLYIAAEANLLPLEKDMGQGDAAKAEQLYRQLVEKHPDHARAARSHLRIGWCLHRAKKYADAVKYLQDNLGRLKTPEHVAEAQLLIGRSYTADNKHAEAITAYQAATSAKPDWERSDEVLIGAAQSHRALDKPDEAANELRKLVDSFAASDLRDQALFQLGEIAQEKGNHDEAIGRFQEVVDKYKDGDLAAPAQYGLAAAQFAKQQYDPARTALDALLAGQAAPEVTARALLLRGLVFQRKKEFDSAAKDLEQFLATAPEQEAELGARYALALCRVGQKQFDQASAELAKILQLKPDYELADKVYYEMGHAMAEQDKSDDAAKAFRTLAEKFPNSSLVSESWFQVGRHHEQKSESTEDENAKKTELAQAADAFSKGLAKAESAELKEKLQYKLGDMRFRQGNFAEAAKVLMAQVTDHADGELAGPARYLAAESLLRQDDYQQAQALFEQVVTEKIEQYHDVALFGAGKSAAALQNWPASEKHFSEVVNQFPKFPQVHEARYGYAVALHKQNKLPEALAQFEQITRETETEAAAKARFMTGEIAFGQKKYEEAIEHYLEVAVGYPYKQWQALAQYETGRCFVELGDKQKAIAALKVVVAKHADHPQAANAQKLIEELQK